MDEYRAGTLSVTEELRPYIDIALPPEHRIVAEKALPTEGIIHLLVEGPLMPIAAGSCSTSMVRALFSYEMVDGVKTVTGIFAHEPHKSWTFIPPSDAP